MFLVSFWRTVQLFRNIWLIDGNKKRFAPLPFRIRWMLFNQRCTAYPRQKLGWDSQDNHIFGQYIHQVLVITMAYRLSMDSHEYPGLTSTNLRAKVCLLIEKRVFWPRQGSLATCKTHFRIGTMYLRTIRLTFNNATLITYSQVTQWWMEASESMQLENFEPKTIRPAAAVLPLNHLS